MARVPFIEQMEHSECGLACMAMILGYYKHHVTLTELRDNYGTPRGGTSFYNLLKIGGKYDLECKGYKQVDDNYNSLKTKTPFIAHWKGTHFIVVEKVGRHVHIVDPAQGKSRIRLDEFKENFTGVLIYCYPTEHFKERRKTSSLKFFLGFATQHKKWVVGVFITSVLLQGLGLIVPFLTKWITDEVIMTNDNTYLNMVGGAILILLGIRFLFSFTRGVLIARLQKLMDESMMSKFIHHLFHLPYSFFEKRTSGDLLFRSNSHIIIRQILSNRVIGFLIDGVLLFGYAAIMLYQSLVLGSMIILISIALFAVLIACTRITQRLNNIDVTAQSKVQSFLSENIHGICDIKVMGAEDEVIHKWKDKFNSQLNISQRKSIWTTILNTLSGSIQFIIPLFLLWVGGHFVINNQMSLGTLLGFSSLAIMFMVPIVSIGTGYTELLYLGSYIQRIYDVFDSKVEQDEIDRISPENITGKIEFNQVSYSYDLFGPPILRDINLKVHPGEIVGIVGPSGAGKSTLAKLIVGLYQPTKGEIFIDDRSMSDYDLRKLRQQMGVILQETKLFHKSIADNIVPQGDINSEKMIKAAQLSNIHNEIMDLPMEYQTMLSETGVNFSGGQRQRILLARALYHNPSILVLDEATSSLDTINEKNIDNRISNLNYTRIVIAHRLSSVKNADRIIVMDKGRIVEEGKHNDLIAKGGCYSNLYYAQVKENEQNDYQKTLESV